MKKIYMQPSTKEVQLRPSSLVCTSGMYSAKGIGYGGVDVNGQMTANSRRMLRDDFDDDDDFDDFE